MWSRTGLNEEASTDSSRFVELNDRHPRERSTLIHSALSRPQDWLRFVYLSPFDRQHVSLGFTELDLQSLEMCLLAEPRSGSVVPGSGGVRKIRFAAPSKNQGTRGGFRIFYVYIPEHGIILLLAIIAKNQKADLSRDDIQAISSRIERVKRLLDQGVIR